LKAAADALLADALAGRRTDDELLGAVLALWNEDSMVHAHAVGPTGRHRPARARTRELH
jgi:hypothetical protein